MDITELCFLCSKTKKLDSDGKEINVDIDCSTLESQLKVIFVLRELLKIPQNECIALLSTYGNPSEWSLKFCPECSEIITKCRSVHKKILSLTKYYTELKEKLQNELSDNEEQSTNISAAAYRIRQIYFRHKKGSEELLEDICIKTEKNEDVFYEAIVEPFCDEDFGLDVTRFSQNGTEEGHNNGLKTNELFQGNGTRLRERKKKYDTGPGNWNGQNNESRSDRGRRSRKKWRWIIPIIPKTNKPKQKKSTTKFKCSLESCSKYFWNEILRDGHVKSAHEGIPDPFACEIEGCSKKYRSLIGLQIHKQLFHSLTSSESFICESCGKTFYNQAAFKRHCLNSHKMCSFKCELCDRGFANEKAFKRHNTQHRSIQDPFKCTWCPKEFTTTNGLYNHCKQQHSDKDIDSKWKPSHTLPVECLECGKKFAGKYILKAHMKAVHLEEYKFKCTFCPAGFLDRVAHERHLLTHTKDKPFKCNICGKGLTRNSDLRRHLRLHTGEKPFCCDKCGEAFCDGSKLAKHKKKAHGEPLFGCETCNRKFYCKSGLKAHMKCHDSERTIKTRKQNEQKCKNSVKTKGQNQKRLQVKAECNAASQEGKTRVICRNNTIMPLPSFVPRPCERFVDQEYSINAIPSPQYASVGMISPAPVGVGLIQNVQTQHHQQIEYHHTQLPLNATAFNLSLAPQQTNYQTHHQQHQTTTIYATAGPQMISNQEYQGTATVGFLTQTAYLDPSNNVYIQLGPGGPN